MPQPDANPQACPFRRRNGLRRAFTVIELLVVIGIIALLGSLLVMGIGHIIRTTKINATKTDLQNAQGMLDEMNAANHMSLAPAQWLWRGLVAVPAVYVNGTAPIPNFWMVPLQTPDPRGIAYPAITDCLDAPVGALIDDPSVSSILRNGSRAVLNTQLAMRILLAFPANKAAFGRLPADRWMVPAWVSGAIPGTGVDGILGTADDATDPVQSVTYAVNNCVQYQGITYRCILAHTAAPAQAPPIFATPPTVNNWWVPDTNPTPILLDAWNNPLIYVPADGVHPTGLINVSSNIQKSAAHMDSITALPNSAAGPLTLTLPTISSTPLTCDRVLPPVQSPGLQPYFVSAGPDGDLSTGDDNIYSFEK